LYSETLFIGENQNGSNQGLQVRRREKMKRVRFLGAVLMLALVLAACAPAATEIPTLAVPVTGDTDTPEAVMTDTPAETATTEAVTTETPAETATVEGTMEGTTGAATSIMSSTSADVSEPFLVDQDGRSLYLFTDDTQNSGTSACTDSECTTEWPPVIVTATPTAGTGLDATLLGTITLDDGTMQATYNGWPLHYFDEDTAAGDIKGQGMEGKWFLVSATGTAIQ
jgi:predicted lipoprotein with Yx(FWY)xxD motif